VALLLLRHRSNVFEKSQAIFTGFARGPDRTGGHGFQIIALTN